MNIDHTHVRNFKSIEEVDVQFKNLNIFIGKNAAGKSNLMELFEFLKDIGEHGLEDAIQLRGGVEYFRNTRLPESTNFLVDIGFINSTLDKRRMTSPRPEISISDKEYRKSGIYSTDYYLELSFKDGEFSIEDEYIQNNSLFIDNGWISSNYKRLAESWPNVEKFAEESDNVHLYKETITRDGENIDINIESEGLPQEAIEEMKERGYMFQSEQIDRKKSIITYSRHPIRDYAPGMSGISELGVYNINSEEIKKGTTLKGKRELEKDGSNLPLVLKEVVKSEKDKNKFLNLLDDLLPFISDWETDTLRDKSVLLEILEEFEEEDEEYLPASLVSDGTVNILSLIIIMYFEDINIATIEEPERHLHPALISKVVEMMEDVGKNSNRQIFSTTHNVEMIKNVDMENIYLVTRNDNGFTEVNQPKDSERIQEFLESGLGLGELYVQNILENEL